MDSLMRASAALLLASAAVASHAGELSVQREMTIDRAPATVWKMVGDFNALDVWHPAVTRSTATGNAPGATRLLTLGNGATISEELLARDPAKYSYSYSILKSPLPVRNYKSTLQLSPTPDGKTLMRWSSTFEAEGADDAKAQEVIQGIYDAGLAKVAANFKS
jgi:mxaD protein